MRHILLLFSLGIVACGSSPTLPAPRTMDSASPAYPATGQSTTPEAAQTEPALSVSAELSPLPSHSPSPSAPEPPNADAPIDYSHYEAVLTFGVSDDHGFRYAALHDDGPLRSRLNQFIVQIGQTRPEGYPRDEQLAFYINAYNALVIHSVLEHWPVRSVMNLPGFFDRVRHNIAGRRLTLNELENSVIRSDVFAEPRIHFAVNCASEGCPALARAPYQASLLESQLDTRTRLFLQQTTRRQGRTLKVTKLFEWFIRDFGGREGVRLFLQEHLPEPLAALARDPAIRIGTFPYDWSINARP